MTTSHRIELVTPATSSALVTLAHVRGMMPSLGISVGETHIGAASQAIAQYCGRSFGLATWRETWWPSFPRPVLLLAHWLAASVTSVTEDGTALTVASDTALNAGTGELLRLDTDGLPIDWDADKIVVTYQSGYSLPDGAPADLRQACVRLIASWEARRDVDPTLRSESVDGIGSRSYLDPDRGGGAIPAEVAALLAPYRVLRV